jgi:hypothetical protein
MRRFNLRRLITAATCAVLMTFGAAQPSAATPPCQDESLCEWEIDCFYVDEDGNFIWFCRVVKRCYC